MGIKFNHHHLNTEERIREALKFIDDYINEFGYAPSVREIGEAMRVKSSSTIAKMIGRMQHTGYIEEPRTHSSNGNRISRTIRISEKGRQLLG
jgi:SOS-response transcriptional repressor LexA